MANWPRTTIELATPADVAAGSGGIYTSSYNLTSGAHGIVTLPGMKGFDAPPYSLFYDEMPALDGGYPRHPRATSRELFIPLLLAAPDRPGLLALKRGLVAALNPMLGPCRITVTEGDGSRRFIDAFYVDGATGDEGQDVAGFLWLKYGLIFRALDPYFYSGTLHVIKFTTGALEVVPFFGEPFLGRPFVNKTHSLNGSSTITVTGDVDTWPMWTIHGPTSGMTFTRKVPNKPDQSFTVNTGLSETQTLVIDTRPRHKAVYDPVTGANMWRLLGPSPHLWPISPGLNEVLIDVSNVGAETSVSLTYAPRFISA
ncbi:phage tail domain-containing protein [Nonomuraea lactucae]|uniref:phage tail domain-containing protein n=1 Tax=Nonomuraea lactucae TaxID=2249762 RepID=UPI0013B380EB|nr:phage tail domain-containing protein [Nonomuraea lactucae]